MSSPPGGRTLSGSLREEETACESRSSTVRSAAPMEALPMLMGALGQWVETYSKRFSTLEFFAIGGGLVLADFDDSTELNRIVPRTRSRRSWTSRSCRWSSRAAMETFGDHIGVATASPPDGESRRAQTSRSTTDRSHAVRRLRPPAAARQTDANRSRWPRAGWVARKEAFQDARRRAGIIREAVWIQPDTDRECRRRLRGGRRPRRGVHDARDVGRAVRSLVPRPRPPGPWHRPGTSGSPTPELVLDFDINRI